MNKPIRRKNKALENQRKREAREKKRPKANHKIKNAERRNLCFLGTGGVYMPK